jgi:hypothetical protein
MAGHAHVCGLCGQATTVTAVVNLRNENRLTELHTLEGTRHLSVPELHERVARLLAVGREHIHGHMTPDQVQKELGPPVHRSESFAEVRWYYGTMDVAGHALPGSIEIVFVDGRVTAFNKI